VTSTDLDALFAPQSIAVVGASKRPVAPQTRLLHSLVATGYQGQLFPVNGKYDTIEGLRSYASVADLPVTPDLAVIGLGASRVAAALAECGRAGVRNAVIITAGFSELGQAGKKLQAEVMEVAAAFGINILGPNTMGFANLRDGVYATFSSGMGSGQTAGPVALACQSGGVAGVICELLERDAVGKNLVVAVGNEAGIDLADIVSYVAAKKETKAICIYVENLQRADRLFAAIQAATDAGTSIVVLPGGLSTAGAKAASSHTGALTRKPFVVRQLFSRAGAVLADSPQQAASLAGAIALDRRTWSGADRDGLSIRAARVGVIATSGGYGVLAADAAGRQGLELPSFTGETLQRLSGLLPSYMTLGNPVDMPPEVVTEASLMTEISLAVAADANIDAVVVVGAMRSGAAGAATAAPLASALSTTDTPAIAVWPSMSPDIRRMFAAAGMGCSESADDALRVVAHRLGGTGKAAITMASAPASADSGVSTGLTARLVTEITLKRELAGLGIGVPAGRVVTSGSQAAAAAAELGFPLVAKGVSPLVAHKAAAGLVVLSITSAEELVTAYDTLSRRLGEAGRTEWPEADGGSGVLIERMAGPGPEIFAGLSRDPALGDLLMLGPGGGDVEASSESGLQVARVAWLAPAGRRAAFVRRAVRSLPHCAWDAAADLEVLLGPLIRFWDERDDLVQLELNPVIWSGGALTVVDALAVHR
jgi:acetate---CoA ligase (ADP-forming)